MTLLQKVSLKRSMATEVREPVKVAAVFDGGLRPVKFKWRGRAYPVKEITYTWRSKEGRATLLHFSVSDGTNLFELSYNQETLSWHLEQVEPG